MDPPAPDDRAPRYLFYGLGLGFVLILALITWKIAMDPSSLTRTSLPAWGLGLGCSAFLTIFALWTTTRGWFGPAPIRVTVRPEGLRFEYRAG